MIVGLACGGAIPQPLQITAFNVADNKWEVAFPIYHRVLTLILSLTCALPTMFVARTVSSGFVCNLCRGTIARRSPCVSAFRSHQTGALQYAFSTSARKRSINDSTIPNGAQDFSKSDPSVDSQNHSHPDANATTGTETSARSKSISSENSIPWYLRESPRSYANTTVPGHQATEIPELPENPPPLLEPLLHYISVTAGLDDLQLLDLRHLDPPPALGSKLIMIIGTARSEKHLHVAADRFCRYLRREHGLKANAAGLLGRNELKIKLRRKAKRMRMLANVGGAVPTGNIDDGIRTGWICCTLGKIEAHPDDQHIPGVNVQEFVGFRDVKPGVNVVVQMFTEEKRIETDLETLWGGVVRTHQRKNKSADEALQELEQDIQELDVDFQEAEQEQFSRRPTKAPAVSNKVPSHSPAPKQYFHQPRSSAGDPFPSTLDFADAQPSRRSNRKRT